MRETATLKLYPVRAHAASLSLFSANRKRIPKIGNLVFPHPPGPSLSSRAVDFIKSNDSANHTHNLKPIGSLIARRFLFANSFVKDVPKNVIFNASLETPIDVSEASEAIDRQIYRAAYRSPLFTINPTTHFQYFDFARISSAVR